MVLWIAFAVMTAATLLAVLAPLGRPSSGVDDTADAGAGAGTRAVYRHQLDEIEAERARGLIEPAEAEAARLEVSRRLLASAEATAGTIAGASVPASRAARIALVAAAVVPLLTLGLYLVQGSPGLPAYPFAARQQATLQQSPLGDLIARVEARLREHPEDGKGWDAIAPAYLSLGRYRDAADAFERAARLLGETPARLGGLAQANIFAADGIVTEDARRALERVHALDPARVDARFWLAVGKEQDGKLADARTDFTALLAEAPPDAPWRPAVEAHLKEIAGKLAGTKSPEPRGPSAEDVAAAQKLPAAERQQMITQMVEGLAQRLQREGGDLAGWTRLVRAYSVLDRKQDAQAALAAARKALAADARALAELTQLAASLGLGS
jgi:cytochrome c-type biogenesis protein CcmH